MPEEEFSQERLGIFAFEKGTVDMVLDQIPGADPVADNAWQAAVERLRYHQAESFLKRGKYKDGAVAERLRKPRLRNRAMEVQGNCTPVSIQIVACLPQHGSEEV